MTTAVAEHAPEPTTPAGWDWRALFHRPPRRIFHGILAGVQERLGALLVDLVLATAVLVVPLTMLSHRGQEVGAAVLGFAAGIGYLFASWVLRGATVGQALLRLRVVGPDGMRVGPVRAAVRAVLLIVEVLGTATLLLIPLTGIEIALAAASSGRTLVDRVTGTELLARSPRSTTAAGASTQ